MDSCFITPPDLAELEHYENLKEPHLCWLGNSPVKDALPLFRRCTKLLRLTLAKWKETSLPSSEELSDFIMELKHLTFLHIIYRDIPKCDNFKSVVDEVKTFVLPRRPSLKF